LAAKIARENPTRTTAPARTPYQISTRETRRMLCGPCASEPRRSQKRGHPQATETKDDALWTKCKSVAVEAVIGDSPRFFHADVNRQPIARPPNPSRRSEARPRSLAKVAIDRRSRRSSPQPQCSVGTACAARCRSLAKPRRPRPFAGFRTVSAWSLAARVVRTVFHPRLVTSQCERPSPAMHLHRMQLQYRSHVTPVHKTPHDILRPPSAGREI
jgi:hypothetical protein